MDKNRAIEEIKNAKIVWIECKKSRCNESKKTIIVEGISKEDGDGRAKKAKVLVWG